MNLTQLINDLSQPSAYSYSTNDVRVIQTHISIVFLAGDRVYKIRKPVRLGFLDFSTLDLLYQDCLDEVRLNRRLAPDVYLGVVGITIGPDGLRFGGTGEVIEWAVEMQRLPHGATLLDLVRSRELTPQTLERLAHLVADFHQNAEGGSRIAAFGRLAVVARNARDNFTEAEPEIGKTVSREVFQRVQELTESQLTSFGELIEKRATQGIPRDTHGDLHLDHIYYFPDRLPPKDIVIVDCVEFAERFRFADPVSDVAFLVMDLKFRGRRPLAKGLAEAYFQAIHDEEGKRLLPFYTAYRAIIRAKVEGLTLREPEVPEPDRLTNLRLARGHWLLALGELESPNRRPALLMIGGLPGTGKSTLSKSLMSEGFTVIRSDVVRKELFSASNAADAGVDIYSSEHSKQVYAECRRRAELVLIEGGRVIVDANFRETVSRTPFAELAESLAIPVLFIICQAQPDLVRSRLANRQGDASDADWSVYQWAVEQWEEPAEDWESGLLRVATDTESPSPSEVVRAWLREHDLLE